MKKIENIIYYILDKFAPIRFHILRIVLAGVFIYFGYTGLVTPEMWASYVPDWALRFTTAEQLVQLHGIFEISAGLLLLFKIKTRIISAVLFINLIQIITTLDFGPTMVRDIGLLAGLYVLSTQPVHEH